MKKNVFLPVFLGVLGTFDWVGSMMGSESQVPGRRLPEITEPPTIQISRSRTNSVVTFTGGLERADAPGGPWTSVPSAVSPHSVAVGSVDGSQAFYRAIGLDFGAPVFDAREVVRWGISGPLQTYFGKAYAGSPDGIFPPRREKPYFDGSVVFGGKTVPVSLRVRGNSSLQECPFPKLKFKVSKEARAGTPFAAAREIKIGTHCADGGVGGIGRLRDERATYREAVAYEAMELAGFVSPRVRRARIEFRDTSPTNEFGSTQWVVTRNALLVEDVEVLGERLGGHALDDTELAVLKAANFGGQLIAELRLLHAMLGNWDFQLSADGVGLWNTDVVQLADGKYIPVAGDFDLASWVTANSKNRAPRDYHPELPELDREIAYDVEEIQRDVAPEILAAARTRFENALPGISAWVGMAEVDEEGRANMVRHLAVFAEALARTKGKGN